MTTSTSNALPDAVALLRQADKLEAALTIMHGSAYAPSLTAMRLIRKLGQATVEKPLPAQDPAVLAELIAALRKFETTVAKPASTRMAEAANTLEAYQRTCVS